MAKNSLQLFIDECRERVRETKKSQQWKNFEYLIRSLFDLPTFKSSVLVVSVYVVATIIRSVFLLSVYFLIIIIEKGGK